MIVVLKGVQGHEVTEADGGEGDEAVVESSSQIPALPIGKEESSQKHVGYDEPDADHDWNIDLT